MSEFRRIVDGILHDRYFWLLVSGMLNALWAHFIAKDHPEYADILAVLNGVVGLVALYVVGRGVVAEIRLLQAIARAKRLFRDRFGQRLLEPVDPRRPGLAIDRADPSLSRWKATCRFVAADDPNSDGSTNVYLKVLDENGKPIPNFKFVCEWFPNETVSFKTNDRGEWSFPLSSPGSNFDPAKGEVGPQSVYILDLLGKLPSDRIVGIGLIAGRHGQHYGTFQKVTANPEPLPSDDLKPRVVALELDVDDLVAWRERVRKA